MANDLSIDDGAKLLKGLKIPPRPELLVAFLEEANQSAPNHAKLGQIVQRDPALSAGLLKSVNAPMFGLRQKVASVPQAISLLGLRSVRSLVMALSVRGCFKVKDKKFIEGFWEASVQRATVCGQIARAVGQDLDACYMLGLLADCAVPAMINRFEGYQAFYQEATLQADRPITALELATFGTHHAIAGYLLTRSWRFPDEIVQGTKLHHALPSDEPEISPPVFVLKAAEHVLRSARNQPDEYEWSVLRDQAIAVLGLRDDTLEQLKQSAA